MIHIYILKLRPYKSNLFYYILLWYKFKYYKFSNLSNLCIYYILLWDKFKSYKLIDNSRPSIYYILL